MPRKDQKARNEYNEQYNKDHKIARKAYNKMRYQRDKERIRKEQKEYYDANQPAILARSRKYTEKNAESIRQKAKDYRLRNLEACRERSREYHLTHREQLLEYGREYRKRTKEKRRRDMLLREYNLTPEQVTEMMVLQKGLCVACTLPFSDEKPAIDHCHTTGRVRGLVHMKCNLGIGQFDDSPDKLRAAADYLERFSTFSEVAKVEEPNLFGGGQ